jgi:hypothetical protein
MINMDHKTAVDIGGTDEAVSAAILARILEERQERQF